MPPPVRAAVPADELRRRGERIERLLDEARTLAPPPVWERVEQLVQALVELYGDGLGRLLALVAEAGAPGEPLATRLAGDELVAGLLALHGLHPHDAATRIRRALDEAAPRVGPIELVSLEEGVARLRLGPRNPHGPGLSRALERLVEEVAPEVARVELEGMTPSQPPQLIQIDLVRSRAAAR